MLMIGAVSIGAFIVALFAGMFLENKHKKYRIMHIGALGVTLLGLFLSFVYSCSMHNERAIVLLGASSALCLISIFAFTYLLKEKKRSNN